MRKVFLRLLAINFDVRSNILVVLNIREGEPEPVLREILRHVLPVIFYRRRKRDFIIKLFRIRAVEALHELPIDGVVLLVQLQNPLDFLVDVSELAAHVQAVALLRLAAVVLFPVGFFLFVDSSLLFLEFFF